MSDEVAEENLWGSLPFDQQIETPLRILKAQAGILNKISGGLLDGRIRQYDVRTGDQRGLIGYELQIVVPALSNYAVPVVSVVQPIRLYPAKLWIDFLGENGGTAEDAQQLKNELKKVLQHDDLRKIIAALLAQVDDASGISTKPRP